jgi:MazG family protein
MVPADPKSPLPGLQHLLATIARLRAPDGCPWDKKQSTASMAPHLVEEAFEAADALRREQVPEAREELGDVLVNVAMISQIASEAGHYDLDDVAAAAADKLVRRHPHVFGDQQAESAELAHSRWETQKQREKDAHAAATGAGNAGRSVLVGVPIALPALLRAFRIGEKAARVGFDWPDPAGPRGKVDEELRELDEASAGGDAAKVAAELGDVLFSLCNLARHLGSNPEVALAGTIDKFQRRFTAIEQEFDFQLRGRTLAELDAAWSRAKAAERTAGDAPSADR